MSSHKAMQLCSQVEEAVSMALAASKDPVLQDLSVLRVEPLRGTALLGVVLTLDTPSRYGPVDIEAALERGRGYLRAQVAREISRKRVPDLKYTVLPGEQF